MCFFVFIFRNLLWSSVNYGQSLHGLHNTKRLRTPALDGCFLGTDRPRWHLSLVAVVQVAVVLEPPQRPTPVQTVETLKR